MSEINNIPNIEVNGTGIPLIPIQNTGIQFIGTRPIFNANVREVKIRENRVWLIEPPNAIPIAVPVTERIGTPVVDMPGCVKISKENNTCLLYTSDAADAGLGVDLGGRRLIK